MLKHRLLTAAVLIPLVLWAVWSWPLPAVMLLYTAVLLLAAWEWGGFFRIHDNRRRTLWLIGLAVTLIPGWWWFHAGGAMLPVFLLAGVFWGVALVWLLSYAGNGGRVDRTPSDGLLVLVGWCVLWPAWMGLLWLQGGTGHGGFWVTFLFVLVWGADTGAYFAGRHLGRHKLAPRVSPGKTWEGVVGGLLAAVAAGLALQWLFPAPAPAVGLLVVLILATVALSVVGDLFESMLKRQRGIKDSGTLLPGHGGILDRIDSLTAAAPVLALGLTWWQTTL